MKRIFAALLAGMLLFVCCTGCESEEERARREIREANAAYEKAKADVAETQAKIDYIEYLISRYD